MKVTLLNYTPHPEATITIAAKLCYSNKSIQDLTLKASDDDAAEALAQKESGDKQHADGDDDAFDDLYQTFDGF